MNVRDEPTPEINGNAPGKPADARQTEAGEQLAIYGAMLGSLLPPALTVRSGMSADARSFELKVMHGDVPMGSYSFGLFRGQRLHKTIMSVDGKSPAMEAIVIMGPRLTKRAMMGIALIFDNWEPPS